MTPIGDVVRLQLFVFFRLLGFLLSVRRQLSDILIVNRLDLRTNGFDEVLDVLLRSSHFRLKDDIRKAGVTKKFRTQSSREEGKRRC